MLYPHQKALKAAPQCISGRTSYHPTRLAFHSYPHLIRDFFNRLRLDPPPHFTAASIWTRIDRRASGLLYETCAPYSDLVSLRLRNLYPLTLLRTITRRLILQKAYRHEHLTLLLNPTPIACKHTVSGLFTPLPGCFSPFPHGTIHYRSTDMFSLREWSP